MHLTTKGRYAVMAMVDLALNAEDLKPVNLAAIAERERIALNYLEQIFAKLRKAHLVRSVRGPGGGYVLERASSKITIADIIFAVDEPIKMTRCKGAGGCMEDNSKCLTHGLWEGLGNQIQHYFNSISLADVCDRNIDSVPEFKVVSN